jgi:cytochrome c oxidase subunit 2
MPLVALRWLVLTVLLTAAGAARADDSARGRELYTQCTVCHGGSAEGNRAVQAPALAGLPAWYVAQQLRSFRSGRRGSAESDVYGAQMARMAEQLWNDGEVVTVAAYVASLPSVPVEPTLRGGKASRAKTPFTACAVCHGPEAAGNEELGAPPLRGREDWYLVNQLEAFRAGVRGTQADDTAGQQMRAAACALPDEQAVLDVVAYLAELPVGAARSRR